MPSPPQRTDLLNMDVNSGELELNWNITKMTLSSLGQYFYIIQIAI